MTRPACERWTFTVELPPGVRHGGRLMAAILKTLLRRWRVKATAILDAPADAHAGEPHASGSPRRDC